MNHLLQEQLAEYPMKKTHQRMLRNQLAKYREDASLGYFRDLHPKDTDWLSEYMSKVERFNHEYFEHLSRLLLLLEDELKMLESSVEALPKDLRDVARALLLEDETWDSVGDRLHLSRTTLARYRTRALELLSAVYDRYEKEEIEWMLS